jgi:hypothetical protein
VSAPPLKPRVRTCRAKRRYSDQFAARAGAAGEIDAGRASRLWIYHCRECQGWHLTSKDQGRAWLVTKDALVAEPAAGHRAGIALIHNDR